MSKKPATTEPKPPNMDTLFDRITENMSKVDRLKLIAKLRAERAAWIAKEEEKAK